MSDTCGWPNCRQASTCVTTFQKKSWYLCDYHNELVQSEDSGTMRRSRSKIGMPMPEKYPGRLIRDDESNTCSHPECRYAASLVRYRQDGLSAPVCLTHANDESYTWDGAPKPAATVMAEGQTPEEPEKQEEAQEDDFSDFEARLSSGNYDWDD